MKKKFSKIFGVGLTIALVASLLVIAAPVSANGGELVKTLIDDEGLVGPSNPMSGIVRVDFVYDPDVGSVAVPNRWTLSMFGPCPYNNVPIGALFDADGWATGAMAAAIEIGIVDWDGDGVLDTGEDIMWDVNTPPANSYLTFWLDTTKNWTRDSDNWLDGSGNRIFPWDRSAHTSVWPNTYPIETGPYDITTDILDSGGASLLPTPLVQSEWLYNEPYIEPKLSTNVKGAKQIFVIKQAGPAVLGLHPCFPPDDMEPEVAVTWEIKPGVEMNTVGPPGSGDDVIVQRAGYYCCGESPGAPGKTVIVDLDDLTLTDGNELIAQGMVPWSGFASKYGYDYCIEGLGAEWIEICSIKVGDAHVFAYDVKAFRNWGEMIFVDDQDGIDAVNSQDIPGGIQYCIDIEAEKKWGWIQHTELDVDIFTPGIQTDHLVPVGEKEIIQDMVYADFLWGDFPPYPIQKAGAGQAIVHWWLFEDYVDPVTGEHVVEVLIDELMSWLASFEGGVGCDPTQGLCGCGRFPPAAPPAPQPPFPANWTDPLTWLTSIYNNINPHDGTMIDPDGDVRADFTTFTDVLVGFVPWSWPFPPYLPAGPLSLGGTDLITVAEDSWFFEVPGRTMVELSNNGAEEIIIATFVEYPVEYSGENPVCVEKGRKKYEKAVPAQVKTPQVRWAGEKIVLEKDWGLRPRFDWDEWTDPSTGTTFIEIDLELYLALYNNEEGSIGNLEPIEEIFGWYFDYPQTEGLFLDFASLGLPLGAQSVIVPMGGLVAINLDDLEILFEGDSITKCILSTEQQGQADVNAALYEIYVHIDIEAPLGGSPEVNIFFDVLGPISNHGFLVYFLAFEDVVLAEGVPLDLVPQAGKQIDITPLAGLQGLNTFVDNADVAVQVRGWFTSSALPGTTRPPVDVDGDGLYDLPEGRYVMPNDWPGLAGYNYELRPNWDLMEQAHIDVPGEEVGSNFELGPYDGDVVTTVPPSMAVWPTIGPFSTLQQWTQADIWNAGLFAPCSDITVPSIWRNTVVPDGELNWFDCPMPQALVIFEIVGYDTLVEIPTLNQSNLTCCNYLGCDKGDIEGYGYIVDILPTTFGTATAVGTNFTLQDATQAWVVNSLVGRTVCINRAGITYERVIVANTANSFTWGVALLTPTQIGDAYFMKIFESPFYMAEIPANWEIPPGNNWNSWVWLAATRFSPTYPTWADWGPYDFWTDLFIDSIIANTTEPNQTDWKYAKDVEVYSDNHGIAAVTVDALNQFGTVTINATAEFPFAPKKGKYAPCTSGDITVQWGPPDLNPHFLADEQVVQVGDPVTFDNLTVGGTHPYIRAQWDFDGDGIPEIVIEDPNEAVVMQDVIWAYDTPNPLGYSVILTMTDTALITRWEERPFYIIVGGEVARKGDFTGDGHITFEDFVLFAACYGCVVGDPCYNVIGDFDDNGVIDFFDFVDFAMVYGT